MNKLTVALLALAALLAGVVAGFLLAPIKNGIAYNNCGNKSIYNTVSAPEEDGVPEDAE